MTRPLVYYISAHGYGHGVRSCDILRAFQHRRPDVPVTVVSALPPAFLQNRLPDAERLEFRNDSFDVGMVQLDSIRVDVPRTLEAVARLYARRAERIAAEASFLRDRQAALVVADIPALPIEAAARAGLPAVAVGNFAWDWIYAPFREQDPAWRPLVTAFAEGYAQADLLLRLPFSEPMRAFPRVEDISLLASPGRARRDELAARTGARRDRRWVLLSFTSLAWDEDALRRVERMSGYEFFTVLPLAWDRPNVHAVKREEIGFSDVLASVDGVISKPGFGLLSDCIVNGKPLLYVERTDFVEYPILVDAVERYLQNEHLPAAALYRGELEPWLSRLWNRPPPPERLAHDGAEIAAARLADYCR